MTRGAYGKSYKSDSEIQSISQLDWAYLAGVVDGEGSITLKFNGTSYTLNLRVHNTDLILITWIRDVFGGSIVSWQPKESGLRRKVCYANSWNGKFALPILRGVQPYLKVENKVSRAKQVIIFEEGNNPDLNDSIIQTVNIGHK